MPDIAPVKSATCILCKGLFAVHETDDEFIVCHDCGDELECETRDPLEEYEEWQEWNDDA